MLSRDLVRMSLSSVRAFSSTSVACSTKAVRALRAQKIRQANQAKQNKLKSSLGAVDPVLGRKDTPFVVRMLAELREPHVLVNDYKTEEVDKMMSSIEAARRERMQLSGMETFAGSNFDAASIAARREAVMRILNMRNADQATAVKRATRLAMEEFQRFPGDTGSSEVQAAVLTINIQKIAAHVKDNKKDNLNTRRLRMLVQQRQGILRYLKRDNPQRYYWTIEKLGLDDNAVEMEFNMDRRYMQDYKFFGDRILIKDSKKVASAKRRASRKERKLAAAAMQ
ncbi:FAEL097Cp [Eremothecium gossypii FDAG1]|nr:FAEL097Cp [Eremothecium gossypii FDAG1]